MRRGKATGPIPTFVEGLCGKTDGDICESQTFFIYDGKEMSKGGNKSFWENANTYLEGSMGTSWLALISNSQYCFVLYKGLLM